MKEKICFFIAANMMLTSFFVHANEPDELKQEIEVLQSKIKVLEDKLREIDERGRLNEVEFMQRREDVDREIYNLNLLVSGPKKVTKDLVGVNKLVFIREYLEYRRKRGKDWRCSDADNPTQRTKTFRESDDDMEFTKFGGNYRLVGHFNLVAPKGQGNHFQVYGTHIKKNGTDGKFPWLGGGRFKEAKKCIRTKSYTVRNGEDICNHHQSEVSCDYYTLTAGCWVNSEWVKWRENVGAKYNLNPLDKDEACAIKK